jgi:hypothetical protein
MPARSAGSERNARAPTGHDERQGWNASSARSSRRGPTPIPAPRSASGHRPWRPPSTHATASAETAPLAAEADKLHGSAGARGTADGEDRRLRSRPQARRVGFSKFGRGDRDSPGGHRQRWCGDGEGGGAALVEPEQHGDGDGEMERQIGAERRPARVLRRTGPSTARALVHAVEGIRRRLPRAACAARTASCGADRLSVRISTP